MGSYLSLVGDRLKEVRKEKDLSQNDIAEYLGFTTPEGYGNYERAEREMSLSSLVKYCKLTGANAAWILTGEGPKYAEIMKDKVDIALDAIISKLESEKKELLLDVAQGLQKKKKNVNNK